MLFKCDRCDFSSNNASDLFDVTFEHTDDVERVCFDCLKKYYRSFREIVAMEMNDGKSSINNKGLKIMKERGVIIDGCNVARHNSINGKPDINQIQLMCASLNKAYEIKNIKIIISDKLSKEQPIGKLRNVFISPANCDDDITILNIALNTKKYIISNDNYTEYIGLYPYSKLIDCLIKFRTNGKEFYFYNNYKYCR